MNKGVQMTKELSRYAKRKRTSPGAEPGVLAVDPTAQKPLITAVTLVDGQAVTQHAPDPATLSIPRTGVIWVNVDGLGDETTLKQIAAAFGLHPLAMEDVVNTNQRPKYEDYETHDFIVLRMPWPSRPAATEQVALFLGERFVVTFQERSGDVFDPLRGRLSTPAHAPHGVHRLLQADYLAYALIDAVADAYFPVLEMVGESLEALEDDVVLRPDSSLIGEIHAHKHLLRGLRSALWPMRDMLSSILRDDDKGRFTPATRVYLRDCQDHAFQLMDMVETYREIASGLVDIHLSSQANRANEVMQVLTLIATIFIPLTFVVGVYGMNFEWMPELHWRYGYPVTLVVMAVFAVGLTFWFRRKGWLGDRR